MREHRIVLSFTVLAALGVIQLWHLLHVDLAKLDLVANVLGDLLLCARRELPVNFDNIVLMLFDTVRYHG